MKNSHEYSELILFEFTKTIIFLKTQLNFTLHVILHIDETLLY